MSSSLPILVPVDDRADMRAVDFARQLAPVIDADVRILSVVSDRSIAADREAALADAVQRYGDPGPEVRVVAHHDVATAIVDASPSASTVCMTTAATLLPHEGHFGSIAEAVVRMLSRPVILLGPKAQGPFAGVGTRLIMPVDGSVAGEYVIDSAATLASVLRAELWVVTVVSPREERRAAELAGDEYSALEAGYVRRLAEAMGGGADQEAQFEVLHGPDPASAILDFADPDGLIAMSTHGRTGVARIFAGSVTTHVVAGCRQPVMVVRPPDSVLAHD
jgi:nucleotide-binding universal stress UspA family protein